MPEMGSQRLMVIILQHIHRRISAYPKAAERAQQHHGDAGGVGVSNAGESAVVDHGDGWRRKTEQNLKLIGKSGTDE